MTWTTQEHYGYSELGCFLNVTSMSNSTKCSEDTIFFVSTVSLCCWYKGSFNCEWKLNSLEDKEVKTETDDKQQDKTHRNLE